MTTGKWIGLIIAILAAWSTLAWYLHAKITKMMAVIKSLEIELEKLKSQSSPGKDSKMKLYKYDIPKSKLCSLPSKERVFLVQLMEFANDMSALYQMMFYSNETISDDAVVNSSQVSQSMLLAKLLAVKLWEGWKLLKRSLLDDKDNLPQKFQDDCKKLITSERDSFKHGIESFNKLAEYFKVKDNVLELVRNRSGAHYSTQSSKMIGRLIEASSESEVYPVFFAEDHGNTFYQMSHGLSNMSILKMISESKSLGDGDNPMQILMGDVVRVVRWYLDFIGSYIMVVVVINFGFEYTEVEIPEPPYLNEVTLPYFTKGEKRESKASESG